jgi:RHS repeat-associated protein
VRTTCANNIYEGCVSSVSAGAALKFYSFGMLMPGRIYNSNSYRYGFSGHEKVDEISGDGNQIDMGARFLDVRLGRTSSIDPKAQFYPSTSPYAYALNTPIQAIDPDGKVVIFINGNHYGDGGKAEYWRQYSKKLVWDRKPSQWMDPGEYHYEKVEKYAFD